MDRLSKDVVQIILHRLDVCDALHLAQTSRYHYRLIRHNRALWRQWCERDLEPALVSHVRPYIGNFYGIYATLWKVAGYCNSKSDKIIRKIRSRPGHFIRIYKRYPSDALSRLIQFDQLPYPHVDIHAEYSATIYTMYLDLGDSHAIMIFNRVGFQQMYLCMYVMRMDEGSFPFVRKSGCTIL